MRDIKAEVIQAIKDLIEEGVLYIDTEVDTTCTTDSYGNQDGPLDWISVHSTLEVKGEGHN